MVCLLFLIPAFMLLLSPLCWEPAVVHHYHPWPSPRYQLVTEPVAPAPAAAGAKNT